VLKKLLFYQLTNNYLNELKRAHPELVSHYQTILNGETAIQIVAKARELDVFTVPTLIRSLNLPYRTARGYIYEVKTALEVERLIERTPYKAQHPDPRAPGPRPYFYRFTDVEVTGWGDPALKKAQREYEEALLRHDPVAREKKSAEDGLIQICQSITDEYRKHERIGIHRAPSKAEVLTTIKILHPDLNGKQRARLGDMIVHELNKEAPP